jgi:hypothetical protein
MDHVEVLLALRAAGGPVAADVIATGRGMPLSTAQRTLDSLVSTDAARGTAQGFQLNAEVATVPLAGELAVLYNSRPVALVRVIYSRQSPMQSFADAFKLRKEDSDS